MKIKVKTETFKTNTKFVTAVESHFINIKKVDKTRMPTFMKAGHKKRTLTNKYRVAAYEISQNII